jgi:large conductance mechanosensitive channel
MGFFQDFKAFALRGNVLDLAIGVIIGGAFGSIVTSLVNDVIMPPIGQLLSGVDVRDYFFALDGKSYPSLTAAKAAHAATLNYGNFLNTVISFVIIALVIFVVIKQVSRLFPPPPKPAPPGPTPTEQLLTEIRDLLKTSRPTDPVARV